MMPFEDETQRCRIAQERWRDLPIRRRLTFLKPLRHLIVDRAAALSSAVRDDVLRDADEVITTDLLPAAAMAKYLSKNAASILAPRRVTGSPLWLWDCKEVIHRRPRGVVGLIGTWNYPVYLTLGAIVPAVVAGNGVLWKPSENTPRTAEVTDTLLSDAGLPKDLIIKLPLDRENGAKLCEADIDCLHFTGSDGVGRKIAARLGERLIPSTLELSGCDALIVLDDADAAFAARTAYYGATLNNGQTCIAARRAFVAKEKLTEFLNVIGPLAEEAAPLPLVTPGQMKQMQEMVAEARAKNLRVIEAVTTANGARLTIIVDPPADFPACREASFAPLLSVMSFTTEAELLAKFAVSPFGLSGSIIAEDRAKANELAAKLRTGSIVINDVIVPTANPATPFGGRGASGWGVTGGAEGLLEMTVPQVVSRRTGRFRPHVDAAILNDPAAADTIRGLLTMTHARRLRDRWRGLKQMIRGFRNRKK